MQSLDLFGMRESFNQQQIMLCFNGVFNASLIDEIGKALRNYMQGNQESPTAITDVFSVYIEMTQNIRFYSANQQFSDDKAIATIVVSRDGNGYAVSAGNVVLRADGERLCARVESLNALDKAALKAEFKNQLRQPRSTLTGNNGAGLGLIDMARKATAPLSASLQAIDDVYSFFSLRVII